MSIKSTKTVTREWAIARITDVNQQAMHGNYRVLGRFSYESDFSLQDFVDGYKALDLTNLENWTDEMLGNKLDQPFFRETLFDNYLVED